MRRFQETLPVEKRRPFTLQGALWKRKRISLQSEARL
jgi:hypothetical protein